MCRLFGFRSVITSGIHSSLMHAENALAEQSNKHPDGWGVAYYIANSPHLVKSVKTAIDDSLFQKVSGIVTSQTIVAHLRKATIGQANYINTHPFQHGRWVFAHNGNIKNYEKHREKILKMISPDLRKYILGTTDSEAIFYLLLTYIVKETPIHDGRLNYQLVQRAVSSAMVDLTQVIGHCHADDAGSPTENYMTFLISNGDLLTGFQAGKNLYYSTHKQQCPERDECKFFAPCCEEPRSTGPVNHLIFTSEPIQGENLWKPMSNGQLIGVDNSMNIQISKIPIF